MATPSAPLKLLTVGDVSRVLRLSVAMVRKLTEQGRLPLAALTLGSAGFASTRRPT